MKQNLLRNNIKTNRISAFLSEVSAIFRRMDCNPLSGVLHRIGELTSSTKVQ